MQYEPYRRIPLVNRAGEIVAEAMVDAADYEVLNGYRWHRNNNGYANRSNYPNGVVLMHRQILGFVHGDGLEVDHINQDKLDNRRFNLRPANRAVNTQNTPSRKGSSSPFRGVYWEPKKRLWRTAVYVSRRRYSAGRFKDELEAAKAIDTYRLALMPFAEPDPVLAEHLRSGA